MRTEVQPSTYRLPLFLIFGLLLGVILTLTNLTDLTTAGFIIYGIASFGVLIYGLKIAKSESHKGSDYISHRFIKFYWNNFSDFYVALCNGIKDINDFTHLRIFVPVI